MVYNIGMSAIHFTYMSTVVHVQSSMHRQPCVVTHPVTVTVCVTMVRYGALQCITVVRYDVALRGCVTLDMHIGGVLRCVTN